ncbi:hypothetical protein B9K05_05790 [Acetobacter syzygii]|uniref:Uncharacterized protein n=1 Tax=Acetobacter syzygii TaxID=146476 RepID=A0A270BNC5_9PROT|nr:hypothetical protein B9K05_05790 [Acetobacter syzygii]PAL26697.1 hypothetical protein B9K04_05285 [Acetobacter syzygii]
MEQGATCKRGPCFFVRMASLAICGTDHFFTALLCLKNVKITATTKENRPFRVVFCWWHMQIWQKYGSSALDT